MRCLLLAIWCSNTTINNYRPFDQQWRYSRDVQVIRRFFILFWPNETDSAPKMKSYFLLQFSRQFFLSDQLANPFAVRFTALNSLPIHPFYQRPQIKHESDLLASTIIPYGFIETPLTPSSNAIDSTERFKRSAKTNL